MLTIYLIGMHIIMMLIDFWCLEMKDIGFRQILSLSLRMLSSLNMFFFS